MIKFSDISFQLKPAAASGVTTADSHNNGVSGKKSLFGSVLGDSQDSISTSSGKSVADSALKSQKNTDQLNSSTQKNPAVETNTAAQTNSTPDVNADETKAEPQEGSAVEISTATQAHATAEKKFDPQTGLVLATNIAAQSDPTAEVSVTPQTDLTDTPDPDGQSRAQNQLNPAGHLDPAPETVEAELANVSGSSEVTDQSDQKIIQLEIMETEQPITPGTQLPAAEDVSEGNEQALAVARDDAKAVASPPAEKHAEPVQAREPEEGDLAKIRRASENDLQVARYRAGHSEEQHVKEFAQRPVSLAELRGVRPESLRSRHSESLVSAPATPGAEPGIHIKDKAIDLDKLSIKQPYIDAVDVEDPVIVDRFQLDKRLATRSTGADAGEFKVEPLLGAIRESGLGADAGLTKGSGHSLVGVHSMSGSLEPSVYALTGAKVQADLPVNTLALRQPGLDLSLAKNISFMISEDIQSAKINVKPAELGPVSVQLSVRSDQLSVTIAASHLQTRESLESTLPRLREQFSSLGFSSVEVNVGDHPQQSQSHDNLAENSNHFAPSGYTATDDADSLDNAVLSSRSRITHNGLLDTFA